MKKISRRKAIQLITASGIIAKYPDIAKVILQSIESGIMESAQAADESGRPRSLITMFQYGGFEPWAWFSSMRPRGPQDESNFRRSPYNVNRIQGYTLDSFGNPLYNCVYSDVPVNVGGQTLHLPWVWSMQLPTPSGGMRPMTDLLHHMLIMQGVDTSAGTFANDHEVARRIYAHDEGSVETEQINQAQSTLSSIRISSVFSPFGNLGLYPPRSTPLTMPPNQEFSDAIIRQTVFDSMKIHQSVTNPVSRGPASLKIREALGIVEALPETQNTPKENLHLSYQRAIDLITGGAAQLQQQFDNTKAKYENLINRCLSAQGIQEIYPSPLPGIRLRPNQSQLYEGTNYNSNLKGHPQGNMHIFNFVLPTQGMTVVLPDMRDIFNGASLSPLATYFALAEVLIPSEITANLAYQINGWNNLNIGNSFNAEALQMDIEGNATRFTAGAENTPGPYYFRSKDFDTHKTGPMVNILLNSIYVRCMATCLLELTTVLKNTPYRSTGYTWLHKTVIGIFSEMGRNTQERESNHYNPGSSQAMINQHLPTGGRIIGDIYNTPTPPHDWGTYRATVGSHAPFNTTASGLSGQLFHVRHMRAILNSFFGLPQTERFNGLLVAAPVILVENGGSFEVQFRVGITPQLRPRVAA